ncbi:hypothetical protein XELAEV_18033964mg [Xenopus laevis]|uniref:Uncharacterized protein n=1 Tax=Xenopus laevis TaxID=8355 RepID=A0A974HEG9_XENLA|nr:hypothetical protein XELAEV_18033964mg [Xenopus laevis]
MGFTVVNPFCGYDGNSFVIFGGINAGFDENCLRGYFKANICKLHFLATSASKNPVTPPVYIYTVGGYLELKSEIRRAKAWICGPIILLQL